MNFTSMSTPIKNKISRQSLFIVESPSSTLPSVDSRTAKKGNPLIDYKAKVFQLMAENTELKAQEKNYQNQIEEIRERLQAKIVQQRQFLQKANCKNLRQVIQIIEQMNKKITKLQQVERQKQKKMLRQVMAQYKQISLDSKLANFTNQHYSLVISKQMKQIQTKYEESGKGQSNQNKKMKNQIEKYKIQNKDLKQQNQILAFNNEKLREDLKSSIQRYEQIDRIIQQKMRAYVDKIKQYEQLISQVKSSDQQKWTGKEQPVFFSHEKGNISFGKESEVEPYEVPKFKEISQKGQEDNFDMNSQCYRASIEGLLEENKRLKKSFQALSKLKQGENLPDQLMKEISIMKSIIQLNDNIENMD